MTKGPYKILDIHVLPCHPGLKSVGVSSNLAVIPANEAEAEQSPMKWLDVDEHVEEGTGQGDQNSVVYFITHRIILKVCHLAHIHG